MSECDWPFAFGVCVAHCYKWKSAVQKVLKSRGLAKRLWLQLSPWQKAVGGMLMSESLLYRNKQVCCIYRGWANVAQSN